MYFRLSFCRVSLAAVLVACCSVAVAQQQQQQQQPQSQQPQRRPAGPQPAPARGAFSPDWIPLSKEHDAHLTNVLAFWEFTTGKIERYRCKFKRWEYQGEPEPKMYSTGDIKYEPPDKGLFRIATVQIARPDKEQPGKIDWIEQNDGFKEHWVCDGQSVFEFDSINRQLKQRPLPPNMQGKQIVEGPLPFLFGAKQAKIRQRFWIRVLQPPPEVKNEHWLEAIPKLQRDAANFRSLRIVIDAEDFLPKGMALIHRNAGKTTFQFEQRETNWVQLPKHLTLWRREFFVPKTPPGWEKVIVPGAQQRVPRAAQQLPPQRQLRR